MALPYDPSTGAYIPGSGMGVLAQPATITNPLAQQPAIDPAALFAAQADQRAKQLAVLQTQLRAQTLKDQPGGGFAKGQGPLGIRMGEGPMGYMTSIGDAIAGVITRQRQKKAMEETSAALGQASPAEQRLAEQLQMTAPGGLFQMKYRLSDSPSYVAQGSQMSGVTDPLTF